MPVTFHFVLHEHIQKALTDTDTDTDKDTHTDIDRLSHIHTHITGRRLLLSRDSSKKSSS